MPSFARSVNRRLGRHLGVELRRAAAPFPRYYDDVACRTIERVRPRTMTSNEKLYALILATRYITDARIPGDVVECGVWRGGSMQAVAMTLLQAGGVPERDLYLCDTFEGMPPPNDIDLRVDGRSAAELLEQNTDNVVARATRADVEAAMHDTGYPLNRVHYVEGMIEQTLPAAAPAEISLLRLDTDWYGSTRHELEHLYDRLVPGGILIIDDYGWWQGARTAVDEWLAALPRPVFLAPMAEGRVAVKP